MATSTFMKRNAKIKYQTDPKTGAVTVLVNNKPTQTFADKSKAQEWITANRGTAKEAKTQLKDIRKTGLTGGKTTAEIAAKAAKTGKSFMEVKRGLAKEGRASYLSHKSGTMKDLTGKEASTAKTLGGTAYTPPTTTTTGQQQQSTSRTMGTQKPAVSSATNKLANAIQSTSKAINKRAGVGKYQSKLRFK